jgi:hypothetical protein
MILVHHEDDAADGKPLSQLKAGLDAFIQIMGIDDDDVAFERPEIRAVGFCGIDDKTLVDQDSAEPFADDLAFPQDGDVHLRRH